MLQQQPAPSERRRDERFANTEGIVVRQVLSGPGLTGALRDVSFRGCLIGMDAPIQLNLSDVIELKIPSAPALRVLGSVRHLTDDGLVAGLEFHKVGTRQTNELASFIETMQEQSNRTFTQIAS